MSQIGPNTSHQCQIIDDFRRTIYLYIFFLIVASYKLSVQKYGFEIRGL